MMGDMTDDTRRTEDYKTGREHELKQLYREAVKGRNYLNNLIQGLLGEYTICDEEDIDTLADIIHGALLCRKEGYTVL